MEAIIWIAAAALIFGICRLVDIGFQKLFRNKAEHLSGLAVRVNKRYGVFGVILSAIGIAAVEQHLVPAGACDHGGNANGA